MRKFVTHWLLRGLAWKLGSEGLVRRVTRDRRSELTDKLTRLIGNRVRYGPFTGLQLPVTSSWSDGDRASKLIGTYEANLHPILMRAIERTPRTVINIGCAEGYYAVGLALVMPDAKVFARDIDPKAIELCRTTARMNGVGGRVIVGGHCDCSSLSDLIGESRGVLLFVDCEGAELGLIDPVKVPQLANCNIIVETHEFLQLGVTEAIVERLSTSHHVQRVPQGARNPNSIQEISHWSELDRWLIVNEGRPESMNWLACWTKNSWLSSD